jgi:FixJ family two-component response regulator
MVTVIADDEIAKRAMAEGAIDYITKPVDYDYLVLAIITKTGLLGSDE